MQPLQLDTIKALQRIGDDRDILNQVRNVFRNTLPKQIQTMRNAYKTHELSQVESTAHSIKSAAASCGAVTLQKIALRIEQAAGEEKREKLPNLLDLLAISMNETFLAMDQEKN